MEPNQVKQQAVSAHGEERLQLQSHLLYEAGRAPKCVKGTNPWLTQSNAFKHTRSDAHWNKQAEVPESK